MQHFGLFLGLALACCTAAQASGNPEAGKAKAQTCAACHGPDGSQPIAPMYPILAGQHANYLSHALSEYKSGKRKNPIMAGFAGPLSEEDIADLAAYFSQQPGKLTVLPQ
jgi:cytochrome c553